MWTFQIERCIGNTIHTVYDYSSKMDAVRVMLDMWWEMDAHTRETIRSQEYKCEGGKNCFLRVVCTDDYKGETIIRSLSDVVYKERRWMCEHCMVIEIGHAFWVLAKDETQEDSFVILPRSNDDVERLRSQLWLGNCPIRDRWMSELPDGELKFIIPASVFKDAEDNFKKIDLEEKGE